MGDDKAAGEFHGRTVFVAGGASGIGRAASLAFAAAGAKVALTYFSSDAEAAEVADLIGAERAIAVKADGGDEASVEAAFAEAERVLGPIDVLFANAGGLLRRARCVEATLPDWHEAMAVNLTSTFLSCRAALKRMEPRRRGAIVTMSSLAAYDGGGPGASHYAAAKGAIVSYTRALAKEVGPLGIRVNGVAPGLIATRFHDIFNTPAGRSATVERTPVRREGSPEDVAAAVLYLSSERSGFVTGEILQINGGLAMF